MAKKSTMNKAADSVKSVAATALGAAAAAASQVVVESVVGAVSKGGAKLDAARPRLQKSAADAVSKPLLPASRRKSARAKVKVPAKPKRRAAAAKKKAAARKKHP